MRKEREENELFAGLTEGERIEMENMIMEQAFENSYKIITKKMTFEDLAEKTKKLSSSSHTILVFDPTEDPDKEVIEDLIWHFEDREEYEKCAELKRILDVQL